MSNSRSQLFDSNHLGTPVKAAINQTILNLSIKKHGRGNEDQTHKIALSYEPDFGEPVGACHTIYWSDCIAQMAIDIQDRQKTATPCEFDFFKPKLVEYTFTVCVRLRLPNEVRFTAVLILNSFLIRHLCSLHEFMEKQDMANHHKNKEWENIESNMERQIPLRILTAIQISSKMHSYHDSLSSRQVVNTLRKVGLPYTITAVSDSEQRVFKLIGFNIPDSPLEACEMALKLLTYTMKKREMAEAERHEDLWQHVLIVLDVCFINHIELYERFFRKCPFLLNKDCGKRSIISKFKCDILLLAAATVQTAFILCIGKERIEEVTVIVNTVLRCNPRFVEPLKQSIIELALSKKNVEFSEPG
ncbi:hypothetical protein GCK72_009651 [Caenorhabditis remanei]|uniref:Uncharacterized protein n=1 Tax=Caenorhabditis remanei TaxID=31234 RepID=A0A6A5H341_CAERE|nr:hypothetical protein GCK72_009651 [Caenorhabditis remanei]KAF1761395.1 hypothetical protein GCK72_009651 [Caenorhabditis remanei]